jgi:hypothetical protein
VVKLIGRSALLMPLHVVCIFLRTCSDFTHASADLLYREKVRGAGADALSLEWSRNFKQNAVESLVYSLVRMQASLRHYQVRSESPVYRQGHVCLIKASRPQKGHV